MTLRHGSVFLIPGFAQTAGAWNEVVSEMPSSADIHALDIPVAPSFAETANALAAGRSGLWAGYSLGGRLALQIALDHPAAVDALVLISSTPGIAGAGARAERRIHDFELADRAETTGIDAFLIRWLAQPLFAGLDPVLARRHRLQSAAAVAHQLRTLGQGTQEPLWDRLAELRMPVMLVAGNRDDKYTAIAHQAASAIGPNAQAHIVEGAGHALLQERPEAIASVVTAIR